MKLYNYKIQWVFTIEEFKKIIKIINFRGFVFINGLNINLNPVKNFNHVSYENNVAFLKYFNKEIKKDNKIIYIEIVKK